MNIILRSRYENSLVRGSRAKSLTKSVSISQPLSLCCLLGHKEKVSQKLRKKGRETGGFIHEEQNL